MSGPASTIVGKLTAFAKRRHEIDVRRMENMCAVILLSLAASATGAPQRWQPTESIAAAAEAYVLGRIGPKAKRTSVRAGALDSRHRLALCSDELEPFMRRGAKIEVRTIFGVRCTGEKPWTVYLPVEVIVTDRVLVASLTLPRGHVLTAEDLVV